MLNLNYYSTQGGRSRDPNLDRDPLFADPWLRLLLIAYLAKY